MQGTPKSKRSRSSEGETPRPQSKQTKMVNQNDLIPYIASSVKEIQEGQDSMKGMFKSKIEGTEI